MSNKTCPKQHERNSVLIIPPKIIYLSFKKDKLTNYDFVRILFYHEHNMLLWPLFW